MAATTMLHGRKPRGPIYLLSRSPATETGNEDDGLLDLSADDFFLVGRSSNEAATDDEWTDKSTKLNLLNFPLCERSF
ncbi:hypothetical protein LINGRAPRIM_LOCUS245 [Linum grandiflorum]